MTDARLFETFCREMGADPDGLPHDQVAAVKRALRAVVDEAAGELRGRPAGAVPYRLTDAGLAAVGAGGERP